MIELATHLEEKAAKLKREGLGKIKIALAGSNTSSLIYTLEGVFGIIDLETISLASIPETKEVVTEDIPSSPSPTESGPLEVELVFPIRVIPLVIAGIPESLLPIHGPETVTLQMPIHRLYSNIFTKGSSLHSCSPGPFKCGLSLLILQW